jgi:hypothetical protein
MKGSARMKAKDAFYKVGTGIHRAIFNVSKGRIFGKAFGMPLGRRRTAAGSWEVGRGGAEGRVKVPARHRHDHERGSENGQFQESMVAECLHRKHESREEDNDERDAAVEASRLRVGPGIHGAHDLPAIVGVGRA